MVAGRDDRGGLQAGADSDPAQGSAALEAADSDLAQGSETTEVADGRVTRAERRRAERREAILFAARRVFREHGYHQASVHDIIDEARIARGTFYLYFASKQEVFSELVDEFLGLIRGQIRRISLEAGADTPRQQLLSNFRRVVAVVLADEAVASIILRDPTSFDEESRTRVRLFYDRVLELIEGALRVGQQLGLVRECEVRLVAVTALGGLQQALVHMLMAHTDDPDVQGRERAFREPEAVADELMAFFLRGMTPTSA